MYSTHLLHITCLKGYIVFSISLVASLIGISSSQTILESSKYSCGGDGILSGQGQGTDEDDEDTCICGTKPMSTSLDPTPVIHSISVNVRKNTAQDYSTEWI